MRFDLFPRWFWTQLFPNATSGGLGILIPLYILELGGTVVDVGVAVSVYQLAQIPGALLWGQVVDRTARRRLFLAAIYGAMTASTLALYLVQDISALIALYALFGFFAIAPAPVTNLLLMETAPKATWGTQFARLSSLSVVGLFAGTLPGGFWAVYFPLREYFLLCFAFCLPAAPLAYLWLPEPVLTLERRTIMRSLDSFLHRLLHAPVFFLKLPHPTDFRTFYRVLRVGLSEELPLLYFTMVLYFLAASTFMTPYTPLLAVRGVPASQIFLAFAMIYFLNVLSFILVPRVIRRYGERRTALGSMLLRIAGMVVGAVLATAAQGLSLLLGTLLVFAIIAVTFTSIYTPISTLIFRALPAGRQGELLGIFSALTGVSWFVGAYGSGLLSFNFGFSLTFLLAAAFLTAGVAIFRSYARVHPAKPRFERG